MKKAAFLLLCFPFLPQALPAYEGELTTHEVEGALEKTKLGEVFGQYLATIQMYDPERATQLGIHEADHLLTRRNLERVNTQLEALRKIRAKLHEIDKEPLHPSDAIDYGLLDRMLETDIYDLEKTNFLALRPHYYLEPLRSVFDVVSRDYRDYNLRAAAALSRMKQIPDVLLQAERNLSRPPKIWVENSIRQCEHAIKTIPDFVPLFRGYTLYDPLLKSQVDDALDKLKAALTRYRDFLKKDVLPSADGDPSAGEYSYGFYLERWHALDMTPGKAYRIFKKSFKRAVSDLKKEAFNIDPVLYKQRGWQGVLEKLPREHPDAKDIIRIFREESERAHQHFDEYKVVPYPQQRLVMKDMPGFLAPVVPYVYFAEPFPLDDNRVSELYISLPDPSMPAERLEAVMKAGFSYVQIELLTAYAVMPGLHLRSYEAANNASRIRRVSRQPVLTNGWACYSELLAEEMGFYSSYWSRFMRIYLKTLRAARAVVDAGLHTRRMDYAEAVRFFEEKLGFSRGQAEQEVLRISISPTEGMTHLLGLDYVLEMRDYFRTTEQKHFDLRNFHAYFLRLGNITAESARGEMRRRKKEQEKMVR